MANVGNVPPKSKATYMAFLNKSHGASIPGSDLKIGQGVTFRNHNWSIAGSDHLPGDPVRLRLVDAALSREVTAVDPDEVRPLLGGA